MFSTRSLNIDWVNRSDAPACLSTIGACDSQYLAANEKYLQLIERVWPEIENKDLVEKGSAINNADRDRRLWLLEHQGYYDSQSAVIRMATGRIVSVEMSAQRVWCSGTACDLEFFMPSPADKNRLDHAPVSNNDNKRAVFAPRLKNRLNQMNAFDKTIILRRILSVLVEGAVLTGKISEITPVKRYSHELIERFRYHQACDRATTPRVRFDFSDFDHETLEDCLLQVAGEIWTIVMLSNDPVASKPLRSLVVDYTVPRPLIVRG